MEFKIDKSGFLEIKRAGKWKKQFCPFAESGDGGATPDPCGDWCPLFDEPTGASLIVLSLCHGRRLESVPQDFIDEREAPE